MSNSSVAAVPHLTPFDKELRLCHRILFKKTTTISHFISQTITKLKKERKKFVEQPNPVLVVCRNAFLSSAKINMRLEKLSLQLHEVISHKQLSSQPGTDGV